MRRGLWIAAWLGALAAPARADRVVYFGEARLLGVGLAGSQGQFGPTTPTAGAPCGATPSGDIGAYASASGGLLARTDQYRYQLVLSAGYYAFLCTPSLRRPVAGVDYRGEHRFSERTQITSGLRATLDAFDRNADIRSGSMDQSIAGTPFLTVSAEAEVQHRVRGRGGLRAGLAAQAMEVLPFPRPGLFSIYSTLGPMESGEAVAAPFYDTVRDRFEVPLRYRVSHCYPATQQTAPENSDQGTAYVRSWGEVPPAQDGGVRLAYEHRFTPLWRVHAEAGVAFAYQPNLCLRLGPGLGCSIDQQAPGVRAAVSPPPLEVGLGPLATGTLVGELALHHEARRQSLEVSLARTYEPNAYASALDLADRLSATWAFRPRPGLGLAATGQLGHYAHSAPGRVGTLEGPVGPQIVSPQDRTMYMAQGSAGADYVVAGPLSVFAQLDLEAFAIRGEQVPERDARGRVAPPQDGGRFVSAFPETGTYQGVWRLGLMAGVRVSARPPLRDGDPLLTARAVP